MKVFLLFLALAANVGFASNQCSVAAHEDCSVEIDISTKNNSDDVERDSKDFEHIDSTKVQALGSVALVALAYDTKNHEYMWKDYSPDSVSSEWQPVRIENIDVDMRKITDLDMLNKILAMEGSYLKIRRIGNTIGLSLELKLLGGDPFSMTICSLACNVITTVGCAGASIGTFFLFPPVGIAIAAICTTIGPVTSASACIASCIAFD